MVDGGHNGLVAACCPVKGGRSVLVLEAGDRLGGGCQHIVYLACPGRRSGLAARHG